jgi:hypothetical protein
VGARIPWKHAARDVALLAATLALWQVDAATRAGGGAAAWVVATAAGALTAICGYLFHEWGHLAAAIASGSRYRVPETAGEVFLFNFDVERNGPHQFLAMSCGGFAASAITVVFLYRFLPQGTPAAAISMALVALGVLATAVLELPPFFRVLAGGPMPRGVAFVGFENERRD